MTPKDPQCQTLPPARKSLQRGGGADEQHGYFYKQPQTRKQTRSSKFLVYLLFLIVILAVLILCFAIVVRPKSPQLRITDATVINMRVKSSNATGDPSTSPATLNGTLVATLEIRNPNFGRFEYRNSTVAIVYGEGVASVLGKEVVVGGHVPSKRTRLLGVKIAVGTPPGRDSGSWYKNFSEDVGSGVVKLVCVGKLSGRVYLMWNRLVCGKTSYLNCSMRLHLSTMTIQDLDCKS